MCILGDTVHWGLSWRLTVHLLAPKDLYFSYLENKIHSFSEPPSPIHTHTHTHTPHPSAEANFLGRRIRGYLFKQILEMLEVY